MISVDKVGKKYRLGLKEELGRGLRESIVAFVKSPFGPRETSPSADFWALKDVSFELSEGDTLGVIGRNGAGKSTLLKILSRVVHPTTGTAKLKGRVASLLEVGTGFHPELTGRENIFLNGAILGMKKAELVRRFDEIVDFSGVEKFLDTPVKRYSSGMYVRLAFAVAAHLEPEILIVDEVLAVGDSQFQKKCLGKMEQVSHQSGRTIIFVSHNILAVRNLCQKALLLDEGKAVMFGDSSAVIDKYVNSGLNGSRSEVHWKIEDGPGSEIAKVVRIAIHGERDPLSGTAVLEESVVLQIEFAVLSSNVTLNTSVLFKDQDDVVLFASGHVNTNYSKGVFINECRIPPNLLNDGTYNVCVMLIQNGNSMIAKVDHAVSLEVIDEGIGREAWMGKFPGILRPLLSWSSVNKE